MAFSERPFKYHFLCREEARGARGSPTQTASPLQQWYKRMGVFKKNKKKKEKRKAGQPWAHCDQIRKQTLLTASKMDIVCSSLVLAQEVWWRCHLLKSVYVQIERRSKTPPCTTHARLGHLSALARRRQSSAALTILFKTSTADSCPSKDNFALETLRYGKMRCMQRVRGFKVHF